MRKNPISNSPNTGREAIWTYLFYCMCPSLTGEDSALTRLYPMTVRLGPAGSQMSRLASVQRRSRHTKSTAGRRNMPQRASMVSELVENSAETVLVSFTQRSFWYNKVKYTPGNRWPTRPHVMQIIMWQIHAGFMRDIKGRYRAHYVGLQRRFCRSSHR